MVIKRQIDKDEDALLENDLKQAREKFIRGGGLVISDISTPESKEEWTSISLRIKKKAILEIDTIVKKKMGMTRTGWILQVIEKSLKEEK